MVKATALLSILPVVISVATAVPFPGRGEGIDRSRPPLPPKKPYHIELANLNDNSNIQEFRSSILSKVSDQDRKLHEGPEDEWQNIVQWANTKQIPQDSEDEWLDIIKAANPKYLLTSDFTDNEWQKWKKELRKEGIHLKPDLLNKGGEGVVLHKEFIERTAAALRARLGEKSFDANGDF